MGKKTFFALAALLLMSCHRNTIIGRSQLSLVPESEMQAMALTQYKEFLNTNKVVASASGNDASMVKRVGNKIAAAITKYYSDHGMPDALKGYQWEFGAGLSAQAKVNLEMAFLFLCTKLQEWGDSKNFQEQV